MSSQEPLMTTFSAKAPATLVRLFRAWTDATGLRMQDATSAALWAVMELDGAERDEMMARMRSWVGEHEAAGQVPADPLRSARQRKAAAARMAADQAARGRGEKKTG
jgi:hypothetical protein